MAIEIRLQPLETWEPGAVMVCVETQSEKQLIYSGNSEPLTKWARLEYRDVVSRYHDGTAMDVTDWHPVKLSD